LNYKIKHIIAS